MPRRSPATGGVTAANRAGSGGNAAANCDGNCPSAPRDQRHQQTRTPRVVTTDSEDDVLAHYLALAADIVVAAPTPDPAIPNPAPVAPDGLGELGNLFIGWMKWILIVGGVGGLLACGIMMTVGRRNRSSFAADGAAGIPWVLGGLTLGAVAALIVGAVM
ncbi:hypothetical protein Van01_54320 [Micromonospora andamanensis]|uniref:DUF4190 domain-containing protein n=1 Tax=Micromonospora andamanensis TaxID=1287068 RepID=A0ABQ4I2V5_9ACTN|nr:hypothetical protein Van01_54320 [Micromonospora andamanensis]